METFLNKIRLVVALAAALFACSAVHAAAAEHPGGSQLLSKPWPAPIGHRQPRAADVIDLATQSQDFLDRENAGIDRRILGICRGC
jgi:hypothetical protein